MILRIATMVMRYVYLHYRSLPRLLELFFWPVMELLVWGFLAVHLDDVLQAKADAATAVRMVAALITGIIFWDLLYRTQQAVSLAMMEELWTKNILNIFISPLRNWEWVFAAYIYGLLKTAIICAVLFVLALIFYHFDLVGTHGLRLIPFVFNLLLMGWGLGIFTAGLLIKWGHAAEALIWGVPFLIQPFSAIFYPLSTYPEWLRPICLLIPSTHVLEGMRAGLSGDFSLPHFFWALGLNAVLMAVGSWFFLRMLEVGRENGSLVRISS